MSADIPFELSSLAKARRYQKWIYEITEPYLGSRILEIGAGIGNLSQHLPVREKLILTEVEPSLFKILQGKIPARPGLSLSQVEIGQPLSETFAKENLDTIVSFNVIEHVENDEALFRDFLQLLLKSNAVGPKRIVTLVPAHPFAFGPVDRKLGHHRRYSKAGFKSLVQSAARGLPMTFGFQSLHMNVPALIGWWVNGRLLGRDEIGEGSVQLFESLCPIIKPIDKLLHGTLRLPLGNSLITIVEVRSNE